PSSEADNTIVEPSTAPSPRPAIESSQLAGVSAASETPAFRPGDIARLVFAVGAAAVAPAFMLGGDVAEFATCAALACAVALRPPSMNSPSTLLPSLRVRIPWPLGRVRFHTPVYWRPSAHMALPGPFNSP